MNPTVAQFIALLNRLAPPGLAESWDNVGLQVGSGDWSVKKVWTALDPLPEVVAAACENQVDLLVTHHPLFFKPIKRIDSATPSGRIIEMALANKLAIFCAHTNLDSAAGGINELLAERMGLTDLKVLGDARDGRQVKLVVFVPPDHVPAVLAAAFANGGGKIGNYSGCSYRSEGIGTFLPGAGAKPAVGTVGQTSEVAENRIEVVAAEGDLGRLVDAVARAHPYETMAYDVYPLQSGGGSVGLGRVGRLAVPSDLATFARAIKKDFGLAALRTVGPATLPVERVAICSGSGGSLLGAAIASGAQLYVSGDIGYHTARDAQQAGIGIVDMGHFGSEHPMVSALAATLGSASRDAGWSTAIEANEYENDPFQLL